MSVDEANSLLLLLSIKSMFYIDFKIDVSYRRVVNAEEFDESEENCSANDLVARYLGLL